MADCRHIENRFWPLLSSQLPDFTEILPGKAVFLQNFGNGTDIRVPQYVIFCFPNAVLASVRGGFRIVSDTLVRWHALTACKSTSVLLLHYSVGVCYYLFLLAQSSAIQSNIRLFRRSQNAPRTKGTIKYKKKFLKINERDM